MADVGKTVLDYLQKATKGGFLYPGMRPEEKDQIESLDEESKTTQKQVEDQYEQRREKPGGGTDGQDK